MFNPGDKIIYDEAGCWGTQCEVLEEVEGWYLVRFDDNSTSIIRPSRLSLATETNPNIVYRNMLALRYRNEDFLTNPLTSLDPEPANYLKDVLHKEYCRGIQDVIDYFSDDLNYVQNDDDTEYFLTELRKVANKLTGRAK